MSLLLDTCTFLYLIDDFARVPVVTRERIQSEPVYVSMLSLWEILIKHAKGRLEIAIHGQTLTAFWKAQCEALKMPALPVNESALAHLENLPALHQDPFDRLLICQAIEHGLALVTPDAQIRQYPIKTLWD